MRLGGIQRAKRGWLCFLPAGPHQHAGHPWRHHAPAASKVRCTITVFPIFSGHLAGVLTRWAFSLVTGVPVLVAGSLTTVGASLFPDIFGISERRIIGAFILWLLAVNTSLFKHSEYLTG